MGHTEHRHQQLALEPAAQSTGQAGNQSCSGIRPHAPRFRRGCTYCASTRPALRRPNRLPNPALATAGFPVRRPPIASHRSPDVESTAGARETKQRTQLQGRPALSGPGSIRTEPCVKRCDGAETSQVGLARNIVGRGARAAPTQGHPDARKLQQSGRHRCAPAGARGRGDLKSGPATASLLPAQGITRHSELARQTGTRGGRERSGSRQDMRRDSPKRVDNRSQPAGKQQAGATHPAGQGSRPRAHATSQRRTRSTRRCRRVRRRAFPHVASKALPDDNTGQGVHHRWDGRNTVLVCEHDGGTRHFVAELRQNLDR